MTKGNNMPKLTRKEKGNVEPSFAFGLSGVGIWLEIRVAVMPLAANPRPVIPMVSVRFCSVRVCSIWLNPSMVLIRFSKRVIPGLKLV